MWRRKDPSGWFPFSCVYEGGGRQKNRRATYRAERREEVYCEAERRREVNYGVKRGGGACTMGPVSSVLE